MQAIPGATLEGTKSYFERHSLPVAPMRFGRSGWTVSPVGFGGYRISDENPTHAQALELALLSGCNLIDTSTNYAFGGSERLVGLVLEKLFQEKQLRREEIVVVTKVGYVQGNNLTLAKQRISQGKPFSEMVEYGSDIWHCISPDFIEDQLDRSLARLNLRQIDVLLLHNPEYFLKAHADHREYYSRIKKAFEHLEKEVERGRIQYYGISSNTFPEDKEDPAFTSLEQVWELAREIGPQHHFAFIQFPFNLFEPGAVLNENNGGESLVEFARKADLGTLVNRPLNAFHGSELIRLADFPFSGDLSKFNDDSALSQIRSALEKAVLLERALLEKAPSQFQQLAWAQVILQNLDHLDLDRWKQLLSYRIRPTLQIMHEHLGDLKEQVQKFTHAFEETFDLLANYFQAQSARQSAVITEAILRSAPELRSSRTLSQKAIRVLRSFPGIHCILVGMREPRYVRDVMGLQPVIPQEQAFEALRSIQSELG